MRIKREKKCREYRRHRCSHKWKALNEVYKKEISAAKKEFYRNKIKNLMKSKPGNWYKELRKITNYEQDKTENLVVENLKMFSDDEQAELIADKFSQIGQAQVIYKYIDLF